MTERSMARMMAMTMEKIVVKIATSPVVSKAKKATSVKPS